MASPDHHRACPPSRRGAFRAGLLRRTLVAPLVAAGLLVAGLGALEYVFTSGLWTVVPVEYYLCDGNDTSTYVSWTIGRNKRHPPDVPAVYLLGGSTAREALLSGPSLAADVSRLGGPQVAAWNVSSSNQRFSESLAIVDNVPRDSPTWVIIGISPGRFTASPADSEREVIGFGVLTRSRHLQRYVSDEYGRYTNAATILPGIFTYLGEVLAANASAGRPVRREYHGFKYTLARSYTPAQKDSMVATWFERSYPRFRANLDYNLAMLEQVVDCAQARDLNVVLLELPLNRRALDGRFDEVLAMYQPPVRALARARGVPYVELDRVDPLPSSDFHDLLHLVEPGRAHWQGRLAGELVRLMTADDVAKALAGL